uniref:Aprataxin and PNK-like factor PBZ domain-containing protein n=1 Tax=Plectus sambesii TaxID=2011161 RepID=A0A914XB49_9BILA
MSKVPAKDSLPDLPACRYGRECYRANPLHFKQFSHPEGYMPGMKRSHPVDDDDKPSGSQKRANIATAPQLPANGANGRRDIAGFHLTKVLGLPAEHNSNALSLSDILREIRPTSSIHFNFMIDLEWLLRQYPSSSSPHEMTLVVGESSGTDYAHVNRDAQALPSSSKFSVKVARARLFLQYGSHHTKMSLLKSTDGLHVLISTANLIERDWGEKTQGVFICSARPNDSTNGAAKKSVDNFGDDLVQYLNAYSNSKEWTLIKEWCDAVSAHDFSSVKARLIASVPGYHRANDRDKWGHMRLRTTLRSVDRDQRCHLVGQFSSIGSLGAKPETWVCGQFLRSLVGGQPTTNCRPLLIYPTVNDVRNSLEGYIAGASLPYQSKTADRQPWLRSLLHRWRSDSHGRSRAMPHIKSYALITADDKVRWMLLTSANLSKAAWGELQKSDTQLMIRSYELGVLLEDDQHAGMDTKVLPYDWPLTKYDGDDRPWVTDVKYSAPDVLGMTWPPH